MQINIYGSTKIYHLSTELHIIIKQSVLDINRFMKYKITLPLLESDNVISLQFDQVLRVPDQQDLGEKWLQSPIRLQMYQHHLTGLRIG